MSISYWICTECGQKYGRYRAHTSTYHRDICGWCNRERDVTAARDYGYPRHPSETAPAKEGG